MLDAILLHRATLVREIVSNIESLFNVFIILCRMMCFHPRTTPCFYEVWNLWGLGLIKEIHEASHWASLI